MNQTVARSAPFRVQANGIELTCESFGEASAPPLLLIMGLGCQMIAWDDDFCAQLAARGYRVLRFDNRDVGLSTYCSDLGIPDVAALLKQALAGQPVKAPYTLQDMAADTLGLLDALGIEQAHVVGASMGGAIAQTLAIEHPRRVRSLCSIMATSGAPGLPPPEPRAMVILLTPTPTERAAYIERYINTWKVLRGPGFAQDDALDPQRASDMHARGLNPPGVARQLAAILASGSRREPLRTLPVPTLVLHGDADPLVPVACGIDVAQTVPGAQLRVIAGMGHALPIALWPQIIDAIVEHAARAEA